MDLNAPNFNPGGKIDVLDPRDHKYGEIAMGLPPFDWQKGYDIEKESGYLFVPVKDQDGSSSCGGQAWSYQAQALSAIFKQENSPRSAKFIYAQTFVAGGGSAGRDNAEIFTKQGDAPEVLCPSYDNGNPPSEAFMERPGDITQAARDGAKLDRALSYALVTGTIDDYAQAIATNHGAIILIRGSNNGSWGTANPKPPALGDVLWVHWLYCGKAQLVNGKKMIKVLNSLGTAIGENGWQWLGEDYFAAQTSAGPAILYAWTHTWNPNPPTSDFKHSFNADLHYGSTSDEVKALQQALTIDGEFPAGTPTTGFYGDITARAVVKFQAKYKIDSSSSPYGRDVGPRTRAQLNALFGN